ncbi:hypothetical protein SynBIOSE41_01046 [Synechococcus sp. BIOS-E4-1]|nr:hypothetical protein SynBIOSE41_01046 [Synechococcus sp. BIOS-E4-1]
MISPLKSGSFHVSLIHTPHQCLHIALVEKLAQSFLPSDRVKSS